MLSMMCARPSHETRPSATASTASLSFRTIDVRNPRLLWSAESGLRRSCASRPSSSPNVTESKSSGTLLRADAPQARSARIRLFVVRDVVDARDLLDLEPGYLPGQLHDPRQGTIEARGLVLDFLEHRLRKVETLL